MDLPSVVVKSLIDPAIAESMTTNAAPGARLSFVTEQPEARPPLGFVPQGQPRDAGFFPGFLVAALLPT